MHYSILAVSTVLFATQVSAQIGPIPYGNWPSLPPFQPTPTPTPAASAILSSSATPLSASVSYNAVLYQHYYMTPKAKPSSSLHKLASYSMSASYSFFASASAPTPASSSAYFNPALHQSIAHTPNQNQNRPHGMRKPHPKEGFPVPAGLEAIPGVSSVNGATTKHGGYTGGNGNEENISHDGSPMNGPDMPAENPSNIPSASGAAPEDNSLPLGVPGVPTEGQGQEQGRPDSLPSQAASASEPEYPGSRPVTPSSFSQNEEAKAQPGNVPGGGIAPVDSMAPGSVVAPVNGEKQSHGMDLGNSFCMGTCYGSEAEAKCQAPYVSSIPD